MNGDYIDTDYIRDVLEIPTLKSLIMKGDMIDILDLACSLGEQLEELEVKLAEIEGNSENRQTVQALLRSEDVHHSDDMKKLTVKGDCPAFHIEALICMYPKLKSATIDMRFRGWKDYRGLRAHMDRILDCLSDVSQKELIITSSGGHLLKETITYLKEKGHSISSGRI